MTEPLWKAPAIAPSGRLLVDCETEVCIIGAGIAGLTAAYLLAREGRQVIVLDAAHPAGGESRRTTAHLVTAIDRGWSEVLRVHGDAHARIAAASHASAIDRIERIARDEGIDCGFARLDGFLLATGGDPHDLVRELEAAHAAELRDVEMLSRAPLSGFDGGPCLRFPRQGIVEPSRYLGGLAGAAERDGARLIAGVQVIDVEEDGGLRVRTAAGPTVTAGAVVVATNAPVNVRVAIHAKQAAYRTYAIAVPLRAGTLPQALYWDTEQPFHYVRPARGADGTELLVVGGEDHKTGQDPDGADARFARLETWAAARFAVAAKPVARWSGQVLETMDGLAFIGPTASGSHTFIITGDCGTGFTHATIGAILAADFVAGRDNPWADTYAPSRVRARALATFAAENVNVAGRLAEWITTGDSPDAGHVAAGSGAVVRRGLSPVAVYRGADGVVHERSAVCPHLGCIVHWNASEASWDCPCHGSRFDPCGRVLNGPAHRDLAPVAQDQHAAID